MGGKKLITHTVEVEVLRKLATGKYSKEQIARIEGISRFSVQKIAQRGHPRAEDEHALNRIRVIGYEPTPEEIVAQANILRIRALEKSLDKMPLYNDRRKLKRQAIIEQCMVVRLEK